jgi:hypothetical protein
VLLATDGNRLDEQTLVSDLGHWLVIARAALIRDACPNGDAFAMSCPPWQYGLRQNNLRTIFV